jgi:hypothetical protein
VWTGGAARVLDLICAGRSAGTDTTDRWSPAQQLRLGRARTDLTAAVALVRQSGAALRDRPPAEIPPEDRRILATCCRAGVGAAVRRVLEEARSLAGPAGLAFDEELTRAVDDLALYVAQQHQDADAAALGSRP